MATTSRSDGDRLLGFHQQLIVSLDQVFSGDQRSSEIRIQRTTGELFKIIRTADTARPLTREAAAKHFAWLIGMTNPPDRVQAEVDNKLKKLTATTWPFFEQVLADEQNRLWVRDLGQPGTNTPEVWTAFDADGILIGKLILPYEAGRSVVAFGDSTILLRKRDENAAVLFQLHRLSRIKAN
jgi:hypothetical protein